MATALKVPSVGESITEVEIGDWLKQEGDPVSRDEDVVVIETDKATVEIPSPAAGRLGQIVKQKGERVAVGEVVGYVQEGDGEVEKKAPKKKAGKSAKAKSESKSESDAEPTKSEAKTDSTDGEAKAKDTSEAHVMPAAARLMAEKEIEASQVKSTGPGGRMLKEDVQRAVAEDASPTPTESPRPASTSAGDREEELVPMTLLRRKIAQRLVQAQTEGALLTTFNEIDMSMVKSFRHQFQEPFQKRHGLKLGFMSFFVKAVIEALKAIPAVNAEIRGNDIVYRNYYDIGVAIGGGRGLIVPVLRNAERLSFAEIEQTIADFAQRAKDNKIRPEDLSGGTFTITNGGVYGSLLSTPIINPPQSGVLGMHAIQDRPIAVEGQVVIRPMMYVALTYDHRMVDGREAVTCLRHIKELVEQPARMLLEI